MKPHDIINERYQIIEKLGQGAFAVVFLAMDNYTDEKVAIKTVPAEVTYESHMLDEFRDNYKVVHKLKHPNIAAYNTLEKDHQENQFFLVMEYVEGCDLSRYRKQQKNKTFSLEKTLEILAPIAQALDFAQSENVAHRDIKPENIRINLLGIAKLIDFGLAAQIRSTVVRRSQTPEMFNHEMAGSRPYMAPELLKASRIKDSTLMSADRYSFGVMCYELLDGVLPFESDDLAILNNAICHHDVEPLDVLTEEQNAILIKMLAKEPNDRFATAEEMIHALQQTLLASKQIFTTTGRGAMGAKDTMETCIRRAEIDAVTRLLEKVSPLEMKSHSAVEFGELTADEMIAKIDGTLQIIDKSEAAFDQGAFCVTIKAKRIEEKAKKPTTGTLDISSEPVEAKIYLNDHYYGQTPLTIQHEAGQITLELKHEDCSSIQERLKLSSGQTLKLPFKLKALVKTGDLLINSQPEGAKWYLDGDWQGKTPDQVSNILTGQHQVDVKLSGYKNWRQNITIEPGQRKRLNMELISQGPKPGDEWQDPITGMEFIWVSAGDFMMGSDKYDDAKPIHKVILTQGFWLGKYPVTQGQWEKIMGSNPSDFKNGDNYPVETVSWEDVKDYITKLNGQGSGGFKLPTEAEWEYACRSGGKDEEWSGCNNESQLKNYAWYADNSGNKTHPVGKKIPNGLGLYDMSGNVWEWVQDWYGEYPRGTVTDPQGVKGGSARVVRGGSWYDLAGNARSAGRYSLWPGYRNNGIGVRLVRQP
jgi:formylglycine-generating enzyme required for sulfatase activity/tRNA A-37 threonylcarbamoyl transferase component Bud32